MSDDLDDGVGAVRDGFPSGDDRIDRRAAELLPEERTAGSANPQAQAGAILEESDECEADPQAAPDSFVEHRTSAETVTPGDATR